MAFRPEGGGREVMGSSEEPSSSMMMMGDLISVVGSGCRRRRSMNARRAATETAVAVRKYAKADFPLCWGTGAESSFPASVSGCSFTERTDTICAMQGSTPATACPVMIACVYSPIPKPETYANTPFWQNPVAKLAVNTMAIRNPKYAPGVTLLNKMVERARSVKATMFKMRERMIRFG